MMQINWPSLKKHPFDGDLQAALAGTAAGLIATAPMTVAMKAIHSQLPWEQQYRIPPRQITHEVAEAAGVDDELDNSDEEVLTAISHFGYGAACGAAYGVLANHRRIPPVAGGAAFGLAVWGASYLGWLPIAGSQHSAHKEPAGRNTMMIVSHLVFGVGTALLFKALSKKAS